MGYRQFLELLRYPVSGVRLRSPVSGGLRLIVNCGRMVDFGWDGRIDLYANFFRIFIHRAEGGRDASYTAFPPRVGD